MKFAIGFFLYTIVFIFWAVVKKYDKYQGIVQWLIVCGIYATAWAGYYTPALINELAKLVSSYIGV